LELHSLLENLRHPPVMFFLLGILAVLFRSDLEIPAPISKFLSLYLLLVIGVKGGEELYHSGLTPTVIKVMLVCLVLSFAIPFAAYTVLRRHLKNHDAAAIAATYGSISAVTFATAVSFLESSGVPFGGYMVAGMALMESPAIVSGLLLYHYYKSREHDWGGAVERPGVMWHHVFHEALFNGSVFLLVGSLCIGFLSGSVGETELKPFVNDIFKGMLSLYMLDMGLLAARRLKDLRSSGIFLGAFGVCYPMIASALGIGLAMLLQLAPGDALLFTVLVASASYIAVPAAMRNAIPDSNMSLLLPMSLGITFTFNVVVGIPIYFHIIRWLSH
jgi:uncharacterized protein